VTARLTIFAAVLLLASFAMAEGVAPPPADLEGQAVTVEGARNFRDVGGYRTTDGHVIAREVLYRSGSLGKLSPEGRLQLAELGITSIVDLRTSEERAHDGNDWLANARLGYWTRDYGSSGGTAAVTFSGAAPRTSEAMRQWMIEAYMRLPFDQAPSYRVLFLRLADPTAGAVVVNCTAGKDRTGIATALVLTALDVPYETIKEDYLLSNRAVDPSALQGALTGPLAALPLEVVMPILVVEGEYLDAAFAAIRERNGSVEAYFEKELGAGPTQIAAIRRRLLR